MPGLTQAYTTYRPTCYVHYSVGTVVQTSPGPHSRPTRSYTFIKYSYNFHHPPLPTPTALCENLVSLLNSVLVLYSVQYCRVRYIMQYCGYSPSQIPEDGGYLHNNAWRHKTN